MVRSSPLSKREKWTGKKWSLIRSSSVFCGPLLLPSGGRSLLAVSLPPSPTSEVDRPVYIPSFIFVYFFFTIPSPQHSRQWRPRWTTKSKNWSPIPPLDSSLIRVDRMTSNCGFLRFAGEVRLAAPATCWIWVSHLNVMVVNMLPLLLCHGWRLVPAGVFFLQVFTR